MIKIMLDPGHGGGRAYNRGFKQVENLPYCNEGDCNFIYARDYLKPALEKYGFQVDMTKTSIGPDPSLKTRGAKARGYDLLISCHSNAINGSVRGVEVWDSTNPRESIKSLCERITNAVAVTLGTPNRGTKYRRGNGGVNYYGILRNGYAKHNFIIEHVFHDNLADATVYRKNLQKTAEAVAGAVAEHYGKKKSSKPIQEAPVVLDEEKFVQSIVDSLKGKKWNLLPSVTIAQAILESGWGKSELAREAKNLFGIKASADWKGPVYRKATKEQKPSGEIYTIQADFRRYDSFLESIEDHDRFFISTEWRKKNYKPVLEAKEYKTQCQQLQACGYATDQQYSRKLIDLIERLGLQQYDKELKKYVTTDNSKPSDWAEEAWAWAIEKEITDGTGPRKECTREQVVTILYRYDQQKEGDHGKCHCTDDGNAGYRTGL